MIDGTIVAITPMEWRTRVRAVAQARTVTLHESWLGRRILQMREEMKVSMRGGRMADGRAKEVSSSRLWKLRAK